MREVFTLVTRLDVTTTDGGASSTFGVTTNPPELDFAEMAYLLQLTKQGAERALVALASQANNAGPEYAAEFRKGIDAAVTTKDAGEEKWHLRMGTDPIWQSGTTAQATTPRRNRPPSR